VAGLRYRRIAAYDYSNTDADRAMLQQVCDEENAAVFISTYYTTPITTPSVFMGYDMIPEVAGWDINHPMWREKQYGIRHATHYIVISQNTADDLRRFFQDIASEQITVAHTGVDFSRPSDKAIKTFKKQFGINKPYWLFVGGRGGYKNSILFFKAFAKLKNHRRDFAIVCTGPTGELEAEYAAHIDNAAVFMLDLSDADLQAAYAAAIALVYPSLYEGFGMPVIEAMACGCPVITSPSGSIPEVAGDAALLVNTSNVDEMLNAMKQVQKPKLRRLLIDRGMLRTRLYSWDKMADEVKNVLLRVIAER
jgi:glycosyltransferase involved in cell wall biosynthesis